MNKLIQLSQNWHYRSSANLYGSFPKLAKNNVVKSETLKVKKIQLMNILDFWEKKQDLIEGAIISPQQSKVLKNYFNRPWGVMAGIGVSTLVIDNTIKIYPALQITVGYKFISF